MLKDYESDDNAENASDQKSPHYTFKNAIEYLQNELKKFKIKSMEWEIEKTQLQAKISYLIGEINGNSNVRNDLLARIRCLEFAISNAGLQSSTTNSDIDCDLQELPHENIGGNWSQGRETLRRYLNEFEFGDKLLELSEFSTLNDSLNSNMHSKDIAPSQSHPDESQETSPVPEDFNTPIDACEELLQICNEFEKGISYDDEVSESDETIQFLDGVSHTLLSDACEEEDSESGESMDFEEDVLDIEGSPPKNQVFPLKRLDNIDFVTTTPLSVISGINIGDCIKPEENAINLDFFHSLEDMCDMITKETSLLPEKLVMVDEDCFVGQTETKLCYCDKGHCMTIIDCQKEFEFTHKIISVVVANDFAVALTDYNRLLIYSLNSFELKHTKVLSEDGPDFAFINNVDDFNLVLLTSRSGSFVICDASDGSLTEKNFPEMAEEVTCVEVSSGMVALGYRSGVVRLFSLDAAEMIVLVGEMSRDGGEESAVNSVSFSESGHFIYSLCSGVVSLWDVKDGFLWMGDTFCEDATSVGASGDIFVVLCGSGSLVLYDWERSQ